MSATPRTVPGVLRAAAEAYGDRPAFVEAGRSVSFAGLLDIVREPAAGYRARGLPP